MLFYVNPTIAPDRLNVRWRPGTDKRDVVEKYNPGQAVDVASIEGDWAQIDTRRKVTIPGFPEPVEATIPVFVMAKYLVSQQQPPTPVPAVKYRKIGLHLHTGNNIAACLQVYSDCAQAGKPIPLAVVINNTGLAVAIKGVSPTFVVFRGGVTGEQPQDVLNLVPNDTNANIAAGITRFEQRYSPCGADAYQVANEHYAKEHEDWRVEAMAWFYVGVMLAAEARRVKVTVGDFSTGTPEPYHYELLKPMLQKAEANGHYLNYHGYAPPDVYDMTNAAEWYAMRWLQIMKGYPALKVIIGETGGYHRNSDAIMAMLRQYQAMLATYENVVGAAVFTANAAQDWVDRGFGFDPYLDEYREWFKSL